MILRLLLALLLFGSLPAYANENERTEQAAVTTDSLGNSYSTMSVFSTNSTVPNSFSLKNTGLATSIGVMYKATSTGTVSVSIQALRSFTPPAKEGTLDSRYVIWNAAFTTSDNNWHMATLDTVVEPYLVFQATGTGSNSGGTTLQIEVEKL